ncbi:phosphotransferase family protein [Kribbella soli]|uniref:Aminoglycoside phosphotransferase domain-containing protein n=1 Tax=Kribbella soli TaxID=1124743 RepID=A0A4R0GXF5_9ACTN|nr:phosphotransferase [Kribbella soli]TCC01823.1 hypothetical protein E0H45_40830 [Kribbella soli]
MTGPVVVDVGRVEAWAGRQIVGDVRRVALEGGRVSPVVERVIGPVSGGVPVCERAYRMLDRFVDDERLLAGLERLPVTLLHGDVHGDNVIVDDLGRPVLVDWGSARIGPAMLDVTLAAGPSGFASYGERSELGRVWATAVNNAMFVGAAAQRSLQVAGEMVIAADQAVDELGTLLEIG